MAQGQISRRRFIRDVATSGLAVTILPRHVLGGPGYQAPSDTLNLAVIGAGGMGASNMERLTSENIVALADIDFERVAGSIQNRPGALKEAYEKAKRYHDFRQMLEEEAGIDAVVIATPDHVHAVAANMAMKLGKHVYVQKPLTWSVYEARVLRETARETGVVTQMGNQGHSSDDARRINEWIQAGAIGPVHEVHVWTNRPIWPQGIPRPEALRTLPVDPAWHQGGIADLLAGAMGGTYRVPDHVHWDLFLGPAPYVPYHPVYHPFNWRGWIDWGVGALGDMGAHLIDHPYWALGLTYPTTIEATSTPFGGDPENPATYPQATMVHYSFPARGAQPPVKMTWYDGGLMPPRPDVLPDDVVLNRTGGVIFVGEKGILMHETYGANPRLYPASLMEEFADVPQTYPRIKGGRDGHEMNWVRAIKGQEEISCPFEYAAPLTETMLLGLVALRAGQGQQIHYDGDNMHIPNLPQAEQYLHREYREGWEL